MRYFFLLAMLLVTFIKTSVAQEVATSSAASLMERLNNPDTVYVVNFWATWCSPCVKELPEFEKIADKYPNMPVKVLLVNLDDRDKYQQRVPFFKKKKDIKQEIIWLDEKNAGEKIMEMEPTWRGFIPATFIIAAGTEYRKFYEAVVNAELLCPLIEKQLKLL